MVDEVTPDGPAAKAGISAHDLITSIDGTAVRSVRQFAEALGRHKPGEAMELTLVRASDGSHAEVTVTLGSNPKDASRAYIGLSIVEYMLLVPEGQTPPSQKQAPTVI
jgi:S1-C subfamily serine protease